MTEAAAQAPAEAPVFVVDDDDDYRELLALALQWHCGVGRVEGFSDGAQALQRIADAPAAERPRLVLLDFHMPRLTGLAVLDALRERDLPVTAAVISNAASAEDRERCLAAGARAFVQKPAQFEGLVVALRQLLRDVQAPGVAA